MYRLLLILVILLLSSFRLLAQKMPLGLWNSETVMVTGDSLTRLGGNIEFQSHNNQVFEGFQYLEVKGALTYFVNPHFTIATGAGRINTYQGASTETENRLYEQITNNQFFPWIKIQSRLSIEQRWVDNRYSNRFRYRLNGFIPLNRKEIVAKTYFISAYNEVFFNNRSPVFERNRAFGGFGYQFDHSFSIQSGITNQYDYSPAKSADKNFATLALLYRIRRKDEIHREIMPTASN